MTALYERPDATNARLSNLSIRPGELDGVELPRLSLVVDIDDVLFPWYDRAHAASVAAGLARPNGFLPTSWTPWIEYGCTSEQWWEALREATHTGSLYTGDPFPGAVPALWKLESAGHYIHLVTARGTHPDIPPRTKAAIHAQTYAWLSKHYVPHETVTFSHDKTIVPADFSVDDNLANYDALESVGHHPYLVNRPWNQEPGDKRRRVDSLADFASQIIGDAK